MPFAVERRSQPERASAWVGTLVGPTLLLLAAWFIWGPNLVVIPSRVATTIGPRLLSTEPRRVVLGDPPMIEIDGKRRECMDCHRLFRAGEKAPLALLQHRHVQLEHGINDRCWNCHDGEDRNKLVLYDGTKIGFVDSPTLCGKCHGPVHRDWERGIHGKSTGYWDVSRGPVRRFKCTECHDPHNPRSPAMDRIAPLPGPRSVYPAPHESHQQAGRPGAHEARRVAPERFRP